ncbi:MAG TPA: hypothetical protein VH024_00680 [Candidatus Angelobacter sp.]|jgi:hypothetical protein|nr:hypothetical protein [Candidatus Angelobacter sp.]
MAKRNFFAELMEGVAAMGVLRQGKLTLRNYKIKATTDLPAMPPSLKERLTARPFAPLVPAATKN